MTRRHDDVRDLDIGVVENVRVRIVDVAEQMRIMFGANAESVAGQPLPPHDYRFEVEWPTGARSTFPIGPVSAEQVMQHGLERGDIKEN